MIQVESRLTVCDNSGAKEALCIRVLGGTGRRYASVGDGIVVSVKSVIPSSDIKKGAVSKALIVRTKKEIRRAEDVYKRQYRSRSLCCYSSENCRKGRLSSCSVGFPGQEGKAHYKADVYKRQLDSCRYRSARIREDYCRFERRVRSYACQQENGARSVSYTHLMQILPMMPARVRLLITCSSQKRDTTWVM